MSNSNTPEPRRPLGDEAAALGAIVAREFRRRLIDEQLPRITRCVELLGGDRVWQRPSPNCNSVGNLILHLAGNTTQWILCQFGGVDDDRQRDAEFAADGGRSPADLIELLGRVYHGACDAVDEASVDDLLRPCQVQGYTETGLSAILHVLEHSSGHAGQIYAWTKQATGVDLAFYDL